MSKGDEEPETVGALLLNSVGKTELIYRLISQTHRLINSTFTIQLLMSTWEYSIIKTKNQKS